MAIDTDALDEVRDALAAAESVDHADIRLTVDDDVLVLQGAVATFEESSAAAHIAAAHITGVRNELVVDHNLREGLSAGPEPGADERARREGLRGSSRDPLERADDLVTDVQDSLDENVSWDPPHESVEVPTRAESRGQADRRGAGAAATPAGGPDETPSDGRKSAPDLSPEELARAAHPQSPEEDR